MILISKNEDTKEVLKIDGRLIGRVDKFKYLGSLLPENLDSDYEANKTLGVANTAFKSTKNLLRDNTPSLKMKQDMVRCHIYSILLKAWKQLLSRKSS